MVIFQDYSCIEKSRLSLTIILWLSLKVIFRDYIQVGKYISSLTIIIRTIISGNIPGL